jgi:hypothetical protein
MVLAEVNQRFIYLVEVVDAATICAATRIASSMLP